MNHNKFSAPPQEENQFEQPSVIDTHIKTAESTRRARITKWLGRKVTGLNPEVHGVEIVSDKVARLHDVKKAESPMEEIDRQIVAAESTRRARITKWMGRKVSGLDPEIHGVEITSGKVAKLHEIKRDMQAEADNKPQAPDNPFSA